MMHLTREQIEREFVLSLDIARDWVRRAKLGEFSDGTLMTKADQSVFVRQGRGLQWNAMHLRQYRLRKLDERARESAA